MISSASTRVPSDRADQARARILSAAIGEFSLNGLAGARTERIAEAAGINKALIYYYFKGKEALYAEALESVVEGVRISSFAVLDAESSPGERFLRLVLNHFDRIHSNWAFQTLMQQEMIRLHRGETNALAPLAEKLFHPLWQRVKAVVDEGIESGEMISVDWMQMLYAGMGANVFYFLSAPIMKLTAGFDPLERTAISRRRKASIEYLGQCIFMNRRHGSTVAGRVLASTPMPRKEDVCAAIQVMRALRTRMAAKHDSQPLKQARHK